MDKPRSRKASSPATATGSSTRAVKAPKEPNVRFGVAGKSGADRYTTRGKDTEEFGKGNVRKRLYGYAAQGTPLSAAAQKKRVPADRGTRTTGKKK
jgi:hypothetical protein